ncbi:MAG: hypothetical protein EA394_04980 [Bacteroidia bacterium]|nr:MAG: hypothetical protein EA394_04980 [Bacteroidia bacterium]
MKIGKYISELLYHHEVVVLPGFGSFTTKYVPARFIPEKKIVESPAKRAHFSETGKDADSPLPAYIAHQEGKSIQEVNETLQEIVNNIHESLQQGKKVELENLGILSKDVEGMIRFTANENINYLDEGSEAVAVPTATPPVAEEGTERLEATTVPPPPPASKPQSEKPKRRRMPLFLWWLAILIIPLIIILIILFLNFNFFFGECRLFRSHDRPVVEITDEKEDEVVDDEIDEEWIDEEEISIEPEPVEEEIIPLKPEPGRKTYFLVVGSFRNEFKAAEMAERLRNDGAVQAQVFMKTPANYYRVCYGFYYDLAEAQAQKANLPDDLRQVAWILHR